MTSTRGTTKSSGTKLITAHANPPSWTEVAPAYDHAEMTTVAAAHVAFELLALMLLGRSAGR